MYAAATLKWHYTSWTMLSGGVGAAICKSCVCTMPVLHIELSLAPKHLTVSAQRVRECGRMRIDFLKKKNSKYPAEPRLKNKYCKTTLSIITISYRHYSHTTPEASSEETDAIKKKILSWFTHLHGEYLYDFLSFVKHKRWYFNFIFLPYNEV